MQASPATFQTRDGLALHLNDWPVAQPRARMLLVHGLGEHSGRYAALAGDLNAQGISVRAFDHRGHGKSGGTRGVNGRDADCLSRDALEVFESYAAEGSDLPFLFGHSMGGLVAMHAVGRLGLRPRGLIASSPALASHAGKFDRLLSKVLLRLAPDLTVANGLPADKLSHAPGIERAYLDDPDNHNRVSARVAQYIFEAGPEVIAAAPGWSVPTLLQIAGSDLLVDPAGARAFAAAAPKASVECHDYTDLYHEIYNEADPARTGVVADLSKWLAARL
ncbi:alpha/beta fold hydrolase [Pseudoxanthomonas gei]|uniref:Alpha/beta fold hydrolase n=1 Tax=Pseudoxanthomonas gei TaxID=1383030 RepID=A0ABX0AGA8_9GAMM|nr:alpha/beta hydrolase [Pseudoxanthomonas gei]NDK38274.1 alpha/beta fold hydrolase [Pseudoxanthomonas gei]